MATWTSFLNLKKPATSENFNILDMNNNMDKIDEGVSTLNSKFTWKEFLNVTNVSVGNTYASTGRTFTLQKASLVKISMSYGSGRPLALGAKLSETASSASVALVNVVNNDISDTSGLMVTALLEAGTYYVWARTASASGSTTLQVYGMELGN